MYGVKNEREVKLSKIAKWCQVGRSVKYIIRIQLESISSCIFHSKIKFEEFMFKKIFYLKARGWTRWPFWVPPNHRKINPIRLIRVAQFYLTWDRLCGPSLTAVRWFSPTGAIQHLRGKWGLLHCFLKHIVSKCVNLGWLLGLAQLERKQTNKEASGKPVVLLWGEPL